MNLKSIYILYRILGNGRSLRKLPIGSFREAHGNCRLLVKRMDRFAFVKFFSPELEARLGHLMTEKISVNPAVNGYLFQLGTDKAGKGEGRALVFICYAQDTMVL